MSRLKQLIHEIHRRSLWQVLGIYLASSWLVFEVVQTLTEGVGLPGWVPSGALVALLIGLPIVLATAFVQEGMGGRTEAAPTEAKSSSSEDAGTPGDVPPPGAGRAPVGNHLFTWRNAILGGVAAFTLLGLATAGYMAMRVLGIGPAATLIAQGTLDERDPIILADFVGDDSLLARTVTETLRIDLSGSRVVGLMPPGELEAALERMERDPGDPLTLEVAREVALREGVKAVLGGSINPAGNGFVLSAQLVTPDDGSILVPLRSTASGPDDVVGAIDELSRTLRERIGESLREVNASPPLARVTTSSLAALQKYVQGSILNDRQGDAERAIPLLEEAVALDTTFAMAFRKLAVIYLLKGHSRSRMVDLMQSALRHEDGLTERERRRLQADYHAWVTRDLEAAVAAYQRALALEPDSNSLHNLSVIYGSLRRFDEAEWANERSIIHSADASIYQQAFDDVVWKYALGKREEAFAALERAQELSTETARWDWIKINLAIAEASYDKADSAIAAFEANHGDNPNWAGRARWARANLVWLRGRLREALAEYGRILEGQAERGDPGQSYLVDTAELSRLRVELGDRAGGLRAVGEALDRFPLDSIEPLDRPYFALSEAYTRLGEPQQARALVRKWETKIDPELGDPGGLGAAWPNAFLPQGLGAARPKAFLALHEGRPEEAVELFRQVDAKEGSPCPICLLDEIGQAYDEAGMADSAIAVYERYLNTPWIFRLYDDARARAPILERLGQLYDERGDPENAAKYYAQFVELWQGADPELQRRVEAAQQRLEGIVAEMG